MTAACGKDEIHSVLRDTRRLGETRNSIELGGILIYPGLGIVGNGTVQGATSFGCC